jgi:hypothetical protein
MGLWCTEQGGARAREIEYVERRTTINMQLFAGPSGEAKRDATLRRVSLHRPFRCLLCVIIFIASR